MKNIRREDILMKISTGQSYKGITDNKKAISKNKVNSREQTDSVILDSTEGKSDLSCLGKELGELKSSVYDSKKGSFSNFLYNTLENDSAHPYIINFNYTPVLGVLGLVAGGIAGKVGGPVSAAIIGIGGAAVGAIAANTVRTLANKEPDGKKKVLSIAAAGAAIGATTATMCSVGPFSAAVITGLGGSFIGIGMDRYQTSYYPGFEIKT